MRTFKFRAWLVDEMIADPIIYGLKGNQLVVGAALNEGLDNFFEDGEGKYVLMQFTGLLDKHKNPIYEGDIIRYIDPWGRKEVDHIQGQVIFGKGSYSSHEQGADNTYSYLGWLISSKYSNSPLAQSSCEEVCGNIYEHPELLK